MRDRIIAIVAGALFIFGLFGLIGVFPDVDSIWKILGLASPLKFTITPGRDVHTPLLFIIIACVTSIVVTTLAVRQDFVWRIMGIPVAGTQRTSTPLLVPVPDTNRSNINRECGSCKKDGEEK